jgi:hypothetical protein
MRIIEKSPQIFALVTFLVLVLAIIHEFAYFAVVGPQFQSLMTATDYLVSALSWMPTLGIAILVLTILSLAFLRWTGGRPVDQMRIESKQYRRFSLVMDTIFGGAFSGAVAGAVILFGNPYDLRFAQSAVALALVTFFIWLGKREIFENVFTPLVILFVGLFLLLMFNAYVTGRVDGYLALTNQQNVHNLKLKDSSSETKVSVLRLLSEGVLARKLDEQKVLFYRWDWIEALSLDFVPPDSRSLACRELNFSCLKIPIVPTTSPEHNPFSGAGQASPAPAPSPSGTK